MRAKPVKIVKVTDGYHVFVHDVPVVRSGKGVTFDKQRAGLKVPPGYVAPASTEPMLVEKAGDAASLAHQVGRYVLDLGDFVAGYTELVNIGGDHSVW
jgi:hypothetical protein